MKFSAAAIAIATALFASSVSADNYPAKVDIRCKDVDWAGLTLEEEAFSAETIMLAYNQVHEQTDGGDRYLSELHWGDAELANGELSQSGGGTYNGGSHCRLCDPDDEAEADASLTSIVGKGRTLKMWGQRVEELLKEGPHSAFYDADKCKIKLSIEKGEDAKEEAALSADRKKKSRGEPIEVDVFCRNVNWKKLTPKEEAYSARVLMKIYNTVHQASDGGDKYLTNLHWTKPVAMSGSQLRQSGGGTYNGGCHCRLCGDDDAFLAVLEKGSTLKAWQRKFQNELKSSPYRAFKKATGCRISMISANAEEESEMTAAEE